MKINYELAKSNPEFRQIYLDSLLNECPESIEIVKYDPDWIFLFHQIDQFVKLGYLSSSQGDAEKTDWQIDGKLNKYYFSAYNVLGKYGCGMPQKVFCFNAAFEDTESEQELLSILIDHEGTHTDNTMHGMRLSDGTVINQNNAHAYPSTCLVALEEFLAYRNQWLNLGARRIVRPSIVENVKGMLKRYQREADEFFCIDNLRINI